MFKAALVERKINKSTYQYENKSLFVHNFRPFLFLTVSAAIVMGLIRN